MFSEVEREVAAGGDPLEAAIAVAERLRTELAEVRARAAEERRLATRDRTLAAVERSEARAALRRAHLDDLTGAYRRAAGEDALRDEIGRARRAGGRLVLAILDVDGLKEVNDTRGHLAGDELLRDTVAAIRANIRSYEPIVRIGGDEFVFTVAGVPLTGAEERVAVIRADLARRPSRGRFSIGMTELRPSDDLSDLLRRADAALVEAHRKRDARRFRPSGAAGDARPR